MTLSINASIASVVVAFCYLAFWGDSALTVIIRLANLCFAVALGGLAVLFGGRALKGDVDYVKA